MCDGVDFCMCVEGLRRAEKHTGSPGTGARGGWEPPDKVIGTELKASL